MGEIRIREKEKEKIERKREREDEGILLPSLPTLSCHPFTHPFVLPTLAHKQEFSVFTTPITNNLSATDGTKLCLMSSRLGNAISVYFTSASAS